MVPLALLYAYFVVGFCSSFPATSVVFTLMEKHGYDAAKLASLSLYTAIPWVMKPIIASISDSCPIFGYKRIPFVCAGSLFCTGSLFLTPQASDLGGDRLTIALVATSLGLCVVDVCCDSLSVSMVKTEKTRGSTQSSTWLWRTAGAAIGTGLGGVLFSRLGGVQSRNAFVAVTGISGLFTLALSICAFDIGEKKSKTKSSTNPSKAMSMAFSNLSRIPYITFAAVLLAIIPETESGMLFYYKSSNIGPDHLSIIYICGSLSSIICLSCYSTFCKCTYRNSFAVGTLLCAISEFVGYVIADDRVEMVLEIGCLRSVIKSAGATFLLMPIIILVGKKTPKSSEGTAYSLFLSIMNLGSVGSEAISSAVLSKLHVKDRHTDNVRVFLLAVTFLTFCAVPVATILPSEFSEMIEQSKEEYKGSSDDSGCGFDSGDESSKFTIDEDSSEEEEIKLWAEKDAENAKLECI